MRSMLALCLIAGAALPVAAEEMSLRPESCRLQVTAQYSDCVVENSYYCQGAGEDHYRTEGFDAAGWSYVYSYFPDADRDDMNWANGTGQSLVYTGGGIGDAVIDGHAKASFRGDYREGGQSFALEGNETYTDTGEDVQLSGVTFHRIRWSQYSHLTEGGDGWESNQTLLYSSELDFSLSEGGPADPVTGEMPPSLVSFALPGQPGAGSEIPLHGCMVISGLVSLHPKVPA